MRYAKLSKILPSVKQFFTNSLMNRELADKLREAIKQSGLSANQLAKETGVTQTTISGFLRGRDMGIEKASRIAAYLKLELVEAKRRR